MLLACCRWRVSAVSSAHSEGAPDCPHDREFEFLAGRRPSDGGVRDEHAEDEMKYGLRVAIWIAR